MLLYPQINPVAINIGGFAVYWYGVMYTLAFIIFLYSGKWRIRHYGHPILTESDIEGFLIYGAAGILIGGRLGDCIFYHPEFYLFHPLDIFKPWNGGMSFHGGLIGVCLGVYLFSRRLNCSFLALMDFCWVAAPIGLFFGRIGNFINDELWGRVCSPDLPWGMVFPSGGSLLRHPSQLYEALGEGILLFVILFYFSQRKRLAGQTFSLFLIAYGVIRFSLEFFREPDAFASGVIQATGLSLGQLYSIPVIIIGLVFFILSSRGMFE